MARGMLTDSCLIQAIKDIFSNTVRGGEDPMDKDDETDSETSDDEVQILGSDCTHIRSLRDIDEEAVDNIDDHILDSDNDDLHTSHQPTPTPANNEDDEDNDCGPVESGPLMNKVRLTGKRGQKLLPQVTQKLKHCLQYPHENTPHHSMHSV